MLTLGRGGGAPLATPSDSIICVPGVMGVARGVAAGGWLVYTLLISEETDTAAADPTDPL